jgi:hyperosmotically inducible protein
MKRIATLLLAVCFAASAALAQAAPKKADPSEPRLALPTGPEHGIGAKGEARIVREVRHVLVMEPYYTLWDDLRYKVDGDTVTLLGKVVNSTLKSDAGHDVAKIEGVRHVINKLEVLPPSPADDRIRIATARAIFNNDGLSRYAMGAVPPIHIIVDNGHVTLTGVVAFPMDKQIAGMQASSVPGVFSVKNDLRVEHPVVEAKK